MVYYLVISLHSLFLIKQIHTTDSEAITTALKPFNSISRESIQSEGMIYKTTTWSCINNWNNNNNNNNKDNDNE